MFVCYWYQMFHVSGLLPREDIKQMLRKDGEYLLRLTEPKAGEPRSLVLSVADPTRDNPRHYVIQFENGSYFIEAAQKFPDIPSLVRSYQKIPLGGFFFLKVPVTRQTWELAHDDIECTKKLGEGAFGEVYFYIYPFHIFIYTV